MPETIRQDRIAELEKQIKELEKRMPAHSIPMGLMQELEDREEELELLKQINSVRKPVEELDA